MQFNPKGARWLLAVCTVAIAAASLLAPAANLLSPASADSKPTPFDFTSCVENNRSASVVLLMDESQSIYGSGGRAASDPKNLRVAGVQILISNLQQAASTYNAPIKITLAGFGDKFVTRSSGDNGWVSLNPENPGDGQRQLISLATNFSKVPGDGNSRETDVYSALYGAQEAFRSEGGSSPCKMLVFFKDGKDFQYFNPTAPSSVEGSDKINALLNTGQNKDVQAADKLASQEICRCGGLVDGLRHDGVNLLGVGLQSDTGPADWSNFRSIIEGGPSQGCQGGSLASKGRLILAVNPDDLPFDFSNILRPCPNGVCTTQQLISSFQMNSALSSVTLTTSGIPDSFNGYSITPPVGCSNASELKFDKALDSSNGQFGQAVNWQAQWFGKETIQIILKHTNDSDSSCWNGTWKVNSGTAKSKLDFDADLEAVPVFQDKNIYLVPGHSPKSFKIQLQHPSDATNSPVSISTFSNDVSLGLTGWLEDSNGNNVFPLFQGTGGISNSQLNANQQISVPSDFPKGSYRMVLQLGVSVNNFGWPLLPIKTERNLDVRNEIAPPTIKTTANFGEIDGNSMKFATVKVTESKDAAYKISFRDKMTYVTVVQGPEGLSYKLQSDSEGDFLIPQGSKDLDLKIGISPSIKGDVKKQGLVAGNISIAVTPVGSESDGSVAISTKFIATQRASVSVGLASLIVILMMLLGVLLTLGVYKLVISSISRFIKPQDADPLALEAKSVELSLGGDRILNEEQVKASALDSTGWHPVEISKSRKTAMLAQTEFRASSSGWSLAIDGKGIPIGEDYVGFSSFSSKKPAVKLDLSTEWVFLTDQRPAPDTASVFSGTFIFLKNGTTSKGQLTRQFEDFIYQLGNFEFEPIENLSTSDEQIDDRGSSRGRRSSTNKIKIFRKSTPKKSSHITEDSQNSTSGSSEFDW